MTEPLTHRCDACGYRCYGADEQLAEKDAEIERLTGCLKKANEGFEKYERLWYLRGDELELLKENFHDACVSIRELASPTTSDHEWAAAELGWCDCGYCIHVPKEQPK